ncbi:barstar family protein [Leifsonia sp. NPDC014704]|uniref:barstar family protein n=1 Tax=Leifsonia sp. NPDC014704 TaxID=3364123 RepID=UPI0036F45715
MAVWEADDQDPGFQLARNGFVTKFHSAAVVDESLASFRSAGYRVVRLDTASWTDEADLHDALSTALDFPAYYGRNFAALSDCLQDVVEQAYGWTEADTGLVIELDHLDRFRATMPAACGILLDILVDTARLGALLGNRILCVIRSDDPRLDIGPVGGAEPPWNPREWLLSDRVERTAP